MCHLVVGLNAHPDYPFVVASNRDEYSDRSFSDPVVHDDGVLCSIDHRSGGTWLGVHAQRGHFATLTNMDGRGGRGAVSRGALTLAFVRDPRTAQLRLERRAQAQGFNLLWCEDVREARPRLSYATNCDPNDPGAPRPPPITTLRAPPGGSLVFGLGNDLLGDEHVKSPHLEQGLRARLRACDPGGRSPEALAAGARHLRDALGAMLCRTSVPAVSSLAVLDKLVRWTPRRRLQPGARTAMIAGSLLAAGAALLPGASAARVLLGAGLGVSAGVAHHLRMQHIFVDLPMLTRRWTTVAQTVVVVDRRGVIHFFGRRTVEGPSRASTWVEISARSGARAGG